MQRLEVSGAVRLIYKSLGVKGLNSAPDGDGGQRQPQAALPLRRDREPIV